MDPISAIGLLASLSNLIHASHSVVELLRGLKNSEQECTAILNDAVFFEEALKGFSRVLRNPQLEHNISSDVISNALSESSTTMHELLKRLCQLAVCESSTMRRFKWIQYKPGFQRLHDRLKCQISMLQSFLELAHAYAIPSPRKSCQQKLMSMKIK
jgi:hypothetical protein